MLNIHFENLFDNLVFTERGLYHIKFILIKCRIFILNKYFESLLYKLNNDKVNK
jgi:hypothetical protein